MTDKGFYIDFDGLLTTEDYFSRRAVIKILDNGRQEGDNYIYKIEVVEDPTGMFTEFNKTNKDD